MASALDFIGTLSENDIINKMLGATSDSFDKRQGSVLYDAIISMAVALYDFYHADVPSLYGAMFVLTAVGDDLDNWGATFGVERLEATYTFARIKISNDNDPTNVGDIDVGEYMSAHDDDSQWIYMGDNIVRNIIAGDYFPTGVLEPENEYDNVTMVVFDGVTTHGRDRESDLDYRARIIRNLGSYAGGSVLQYVDLVLNRFPLANPNETPFAGCYIFPVGRRCGYVNIFPMFDNCQIPTGKQVLALKNWIDPLNTEGYGCGFVPIGHRVHGRLARRKNYGWRVWINDGSAKIREASAEDKEKVRQLIMEYFTSEINATMYRSAQSLIPAYNNSITVRIRTSNIIAKISTMRSSDSSILSIQLDKWLPECSEAKYGWVITSDDTMDYRQFPSNVRIPAIDESHFVVLRGNRDYNTGGRP